MAWLAVFKISARLLARTGVPSGQREGRRRHSPASLSKRFALLIQAIFFICGPSWVWASDEIGCQNIFASPANNSPEKTSTIPTWLRRAGIWTLTTGMTLLPVAAMADAGGFSGSGGGGGIATFQDPADAKLAREYASRGQPLPRELLNRARLRPLERWEMERNGMEPFDVPVGATWQTLLAKAKDNIRIVSPLVARRLDQVSNWMTFADWSKAGDGLAPFEDAHPNQPLTALDAPVQLAIRYSEGNNSAVQGPATGALKIHVIFDQVAFAKLDPLDQAMLVLHEQFYALGQSGGLRDSDQVRPLVATFFSKYVDETWRQRTRDGIDLIAVIAFFQDKLARHFGDYAVYFSQIDPPARGVARSPDRHFAVFVDLISELRELQGECFKLLGNRDLCAAKNLTDTAAREDLTEEKAFLFMSYFYLQKTLKVFNAESLMDDKSSPKTFEEAMKTACALLVKGEPTLLKKGAIRAAIRYCRPI